MGIEGVYETDSTLLLLMPHDNFLGTPIFDGISTSTQQVKHKHINYESEALIQASFSLRSWPGHLPVLHLVMHKLPEQAHGQLELLVCDGLAVIRMQPRLLPHMCTQSHSPKRCTHPVQP